MSWRLCGLQEVINVSMVTWLAFDVSRNGDFLPAMFLVCNGFNGTSWRLACLCRTGMWCMRRFKATKQNRALTFQVSHFLCHHRLSNIVNTSASRASTLTSNSQSTDVPFIAYSTHQESLSRLVSPYYDLLLLVIGFHWEMVDNFLFSFNLSAFSPISP